MSSRGIIYEYEDGGKYCGEWENDAAHGHGVCTGPKGNGLFEGLWQKGNQTSGVFTWPNGQKYTGKWQDGLREGLGRETKQDGTEYSGDFTKDSRGPYGVLRQPNGVVYRGMWSKGVQNGEGTEVYIDGGMYRGEYQNGSRHGHGTRSSANYEQSNDQPNLSSLPSSSSMTSSSSTDTLAAVLEDPTSQPTGSALLSSDKTDYQVYEGEWKEDKRHGYGVLKILNQYTYYGQWEENMRSGYGVMIYDDKRKEEGHWLRGKLVLPLKKKRLQLKTRQLESKVSQAHTNALQAADAARMKADLAEGRANTATAKARQALKVVQQALKDAETARMNEKLYKNAPKVQESIKSPVTDAHVEFPAIDPRFCKKTGTTVDSRGLLSAPRQMTLTPSLENVAEMAGCHNASRSLSKDSSESDEGFNDSEEKMVSEDSLASQDSSGYSARLKRERYHAAWQPSIGKRPEGNSLSERSREGSLTSRGIKARMRLIHTKGVSDSDSNLMTRQNKAQPQRGSGSLSLSQLPSGEEGGEEEVRRRHIYKATGEPDHGDNTDEEDQSVDRKAHLPLPKPLTKPLSVSMDMLHQMANWNRMVAYINLALLFFLLFLIVIVMIVLNYYYLVHQFSLSQPQTPTSFMSGPMA